MRLSLPAVALLALLAGCSRTAAPDAAAPGAPVAATPVEAPPAAPETAWRLASGSEGTALVVEDAAGHAALRAWCARGDGRLRVNVPAFAPVASEERMSFGQGGEVIALVAGAAGDTTRGGVTAETPVPANLRALLSGPVSASYGAQASGPHPAPAPELVARFVAACAAPGVDAGDASSSGSSASPTLPARGGACVVQDGRPVPANRLRAVGTEPFWGAQVDGRCVTYSHPENPAGTRVWTRFSGSADAGTWTGALDGKPFLMRTRPQPGCSDGMSDTRYPIAVSLTVGGEERRGCAAPR